jgi:hypothetical protein
MWNSLIDTGDAGVLILQAYTVGGASLVAFVGWDQPRTPPHRYPPGAGGEIPPGHPDFPNPVVAESLLDRLINTSHHVLMDRPATGLANDQAKCASTTAPKPE